MTNSKEKDWQRADKEDTAYVTVIIILAMVMMGLAAIAGVWRSPCGWWD